MSEDLKSQLQEIVDSAKGDLQLIVDAPFNTMAATMIELGVIVLLLENKVAKTIDRIALSRTEAAAGAVRMSSKPFHEIKIPIDDKENAIAAAVRTGKQQVVTDWKYLFTPVFSADEARDNQNGAGIMCSIVTPLTNAHRLGAIIFSFLCEASDIGEEHEDFIRIYSEIVSSKL